MAKTDPNSLPVNKKTGLVPIVFLGIEIPGTDDGTGKPQRAGEAGLGLVVGEVRGVGPEVAARMIDLGTAKLYRDVKAKAEKPPASTGTATGGPAA